MPTTVVTTPSALDSRMLDEAAAAARKLLKIDDKIAHNSVHQRIDDFLAQQNTSSVSSRRRPPMPLGENCPIALGALWGTEICREFGWKWGVAKRGDWTGIGICDPDRKYLALALNYFDGLITIHPEDANLPALQLYNCIKTNQLPPSKPGALTLIAHAES